MRTPVFKGDRGARSIPEKDHGLATDGAAQRGVGEFGGGASVNPDGVKLTYDGMVRSLVHMGILKDTKKFKVVPPPERMRWSKLLGQSYYVYAPDHGLFEPAVKLGATVKKGDLCGLTHFVDNPGREPVPAYFKDSGIVICQRHYGRVERGDCVAHLANETEAPI